MLLIISRRQTIRTIHTLILFSVVAFTSSCVVIEKVSAHKLISGQIKNPLGVYNFRKVDRWYKRTHRKDGETWYADTGKRTTNTRDGEWTFYADTGNSTVAYNAIDRRMRIVVWPHASDFLYTPKSGSFVQGNGETYPIIIRDRLERVRPIHREIFRKAFIIGGFLPGRVDIDSSYGGEFTLSSDEDGYTGYPQDLNPVSLDIRYRLNGVAHEMTLTTQRYVQLQFGVFGLTFTWPFL